MPYDITLAKALFLISTMKRTIKKSAGDSKVILNQVLIDQYPIMSDSKAVKATLIPPDLPERTIKLLNRGEAVIRPTHEYYALIDRVAGKKDTGILI